MRQSPRGFPVGLVGVFLLLQVGRLAWAGWVRVAGGIEMDSTGAVVSRRGYPEAISRAVRRRDLTMMIMEWSELNWESLHWINKYTKECGWPLLVGSTGRGKSPALVTRVDGWN
jgi:hypothetical protein